VAILACCFQVWGWFRERFPDVHRRIGFAYVFGGVLLAGILALLIGARGPFGPTLRASNVVLATIWLLVTVLGFRAARAYDLEAHRRWMTRSVVLTLSIITNRVWVVVWILALSPQLATTFGGNEGLMIQAIAGLSGWLGWVIPLVLAESVCRDVLAPPSRCRWGDRLRAPDAFLGAGIYELGCFLCRRPRAAHRQPHGESAFPVERTSRRRGFPQYQIAGSRSVYSMILISSAG
jgi:hypothetical protein